MQAYAQLPVHLGGKRLILFLGLMNPPTPRDRAGTADMHNLCHVVNLARGLPEGPRMLSQVVMKDGTVKKEVKPGEDFWEIIGRAVRVGNEPVKLTTTRKTAMVDVFKFDVRRGSIFLVIPCVLVYVVSHFWYGSV